MSNLFANLKKYQESWTLVSVDALDAEDLSLLHHGEIVKSTYGTSVKLYLNQGGFFYIPMDDRDETYTIGDIVDLNRLRIKTLRKEGEKDIQRVVFAEQKVVADF